mmetsp:Transcript_48363/g.55654  ORF Transcript_48363/g.55654 Transcript_48363/m.55654 type:complete len:100 (-) Transcript_48363:859-1158(-)
MLGQNSLSLLDCFQVVCLLTLEYELESICMNELSIESICTLPVVCREIHWAKPNDCIAILNSLLMGFYLNERLNYKKERRSLQPLSHSDIERLKLPALM